MIKSINILQPIMVGTEEGQKIFFADPLEQKVYDSNAQIAPQDVISAIFTDIQQQIASSIPPMPVEKIYEVMNTEKQLSDDNGKHVFRRA